MHDWHNMSVFIIELDFSLLSSELSVVDKREHKRYKIRGPGYNSHVKWKDNRCLEPGLHFF